LRGAALLLLAACTGTDPAPPPAEPAAPASTATAAAPPKRATQDRQVLSFAAVPTQRLSEERLAKYRNPVAAGAPELARYAAATECAATSKGRACIVEVPGHETIAVGADESSQSIFTLGSSGAFSVVALNASGRHLAYGLRYDKLEGKPTKLFVVDLERVRDTTQPVDSAVRVLTRGVLGPPGPPNAEIHAAVAKEHNPLDGQVAAFCQVPVRLRAAQPDARPAVAAYHFPCHLPASTAAAAGGQAVALSLADIGFGPTDLRMIALVDPPVPPGG
jgi:hypothetical protein